MALKPLKTLNFGGEDTYYLKPEWKNIAESTVMGDTLTWDGNTDGLVQEAGGGLLFKISDDTPTKEDFADGCVMVFAGGTYDFDGATSQSMFNDDGCFLSDGVVVVPADNYTFSSDDFGIMTFSEKGIYFANMTLMGMGYTSSLTINGYNGFEMTETVPLPNKYLDFIETVGGDTLTWDGNTEGLVGAMDMVYKLSSATPSLGDFANGGTLVFCDTVTETFTSDNAVEMGSNCIAIMQGGVQPVVIITTEDNADLGDGLIIAEKGTYLLGADMGNGYEWVSSLTINGYTGFTKEQIKQEYLPSGVVDLGEVALEDNSIVVADKSYTPIFDRFAKGHDITFKYSLDGMTTYAKATNAVNTDGMVMFTLIDGVTFGENGGIGGVVFTTP